MNLNGKVFNPGELRTEIRLKRRVVTQGIGGFERVSTETIAVVYSKWKNAHGSEVWAAATLQAVKPATVTIRYRADIDESCLVEKGGDLYEIVSMDNINERNELIEMKVQVVKNG